MSQEADGSVASTEDSARVRGGRTRTPSRFTLLKIRIPPLTAIRFALVNSLAKN